MTDFTRREYFSARFIRVSEWRLLSDNDKFNRLQEVVLGRRKDARSRCFPLSRFLTIARNNGSCPTNTATITNWTTWGRAHKGFSFSILHLLLYSSPTRHHARRGIFGFWSIEMCLNACQGSLPALEEGWGVRVLKLSRRFLNNFESPGFNDGDLQHLSIAAYHICLYPNRPRKERGYTATQPLLSHEMLS